ncbi:MAG: transcriptional repressor [Lachnospiraceae bacterium]|nr:transcriptional repressor [Lachnospiraceae bacterium]
MMLKKKGLKTTAQRLLVLRVLRINRGKHLTAEDVHMQTCEINPAIGLATVYRAIRLFTQLGLVDRLNLGDGFARYEISEMALGEEKHHRHHHLVCLNCKKIFSFEKDFLEDLEKNVMDTTGFKVTDHEVSLYGYCKDCVSIMENTQFTTEERIFEKTE